MWILPKLLLTAVAVAVFVLADTSTVDSAAIAAVASVVNTWIILRHDRKVELLRQLARALQRQVGDLQRQTRAKRTVTRGDEDRARVLDIEPMHDLAKQVIESEER